MYPLPLDAARRAATAAAADAMDGVPPVSMEGRRVRRARDVFDPSTEWARPQYGGELDRRRVQRELEKLAAREGAGFGDLGLDDVVEKLAGHMRRSVDEVRQHVEVIAEVLDRDDELSPEQLLLQEPQDSEESDDDDDVPVSELKQQRRWLLRGGDVAGKSSGANIIMLPDPTGVPIRTERRGDLNLENAACSQVDTSVY